MANKKQTLSSGEDVETNANLIIRVSELTTLLSKAQYNMTLIDKLTDFYDCKDHDTDSTVARGNVELHNIYATLWGATTPDALANSIPPEAFGGGFMSRCVIVEEEEAHRIIDRPYFPSSCPSKDEMAQRLLWLLAYKSGEFTFNKEADDYYVKWYRQETLALRAKARTGETDHRDNRKTIHVLKLALVIAAQRYDLDRYITLEDLKMAIAVLEFTNQSSQDTIEDISMDGKANADNLKIKSWIKRAGVQGIVRGDLMRAHNLKKLALDVAIADLKEAGVVREARIPKMKNGREVRELRYYIRED